MRVELPAADSNQTVDCAPEAPQAIYFPWDERPDHRQNLGPSIALRLLGKRSIPRRC
jgi:hypothetical protein